MKLIERLKADLGRGPPVTFQDERHLFMSAEKHAEAAVLIPVTDRPVPGVILTQRPDWLRRHAGQVAFPGGRMDPDDTNLTHTALREAEEEIGLEPHIVEIAGLGAPYYSGSGFKVTPVIGVIPPDLILTPDPDEVAEIFEVPFEFLLNADNAARREIYWKGAMREYFDIDWDGRRIWGVTAGILHNLARQLDWNKG